MGGEVYTPQYPGAERRRWYERLVRSRGSRRALALVGAISLAFAGGGVTMWGLEHHGKPTAQTARNTHKEPAPGSRTGESSAPSESRIDASLEQVKAMSVQQEAQWMQNWRAANVGVSSEADPNLHDTSDPERIAAAALMQFMTTWSQAEDAYRSNADPRLAYAVFGNVVDDNFRQLFFTVAEQIKQADDLWSIMPFICLPYPDSSYRPPRLTKHDDGTYNLETRAVAEDKATNPTEDAKGLARGVSGELYVLNFKLVPTDNGKHVTALITEGHDYGLYTANGD